MGTLSLFRHAKAEQALPGQGDFDRRLTERGRADAARMGALLADLGIELAIVSPAARTRETWETATEGWEAPPTVEFDPELYLCRARVLIRRIRKIADEVKSVVLVGHNPCWQEVALWLAQESREAAAMQAKFPTAALAVLHVKGSWSELEPERAKLERFVTPADLR